MGRCGRDDTERAQTAYRQLDRDRSEQESEDDFRYDEAGGIETLRQLVDVGKDQIVEGAYQEHYAHNQRDARYRDDLIGGDDEDGDAHRIEQVRYRQRVDGDLLWILLGRKFLHGLFGHVR